MVAELLPDLLASTAKKWIVENRQEFHKTENLTGSTSWSRTASGAGDRLDFSLALSMEEHFRLGTVESMTISTFNGLSLQFTDIATLAAVSYCEFSTGGHR